MTPKRKPGRPPRADKAAEERIEVRLTADERRSWERAAGDVSLSEWIRARCNASAARSG